MKHLNQIFLILPILLLLLPTTTMSNKSHLFEKEFLAGNEQQLFNTLSLYLAKNYSRDDALLYLHELYLLAQDLDPQQGCKVIKLFIDSIQKSTHPQKNNIILQAKALLETLAYENRIVIKNMIPEKSFVRQWKISDIYHKYGSADMEYGFAPENTMFTFPTIFKSRSFHGRISLNSIAHPSSGIIYTQTALTSASAIKIRIESNCEYSLSINGNLVIENSRKKRFSHKRVILLKNPDNYNFLFKINIIKDGYYSLQTTTENDIPIQLSYTDKPFKNVPAYIENMDYPYQIFSTQDDEIAYSHLGDYFSIIKDRSMFTYYKKAMSKKQSILTDLIYSSELIHYFTSYAWQSHEGHRRVHHLIDTKKDIPALLLWKAFYLMGDKNYNQALSILKNKLPVTYFSAQLLMLKIYITTNQESNALKLFEQLKTTHLYSKRLFHIALPFLKKYNRTLYKNECSAYLIRRRDKKILNDYLSYTIIQEVDSDNLKKTINELIDENDFNTTINTAKLLIDSGKFDEASNLLKNLSTINHSAMTYYLLGLTYIKQGISPDPYWNRAEYLYPWSSFFSDYNSYLLNQSFAQLKEYRDTKFVESLYSKFFNNDHFSNKILYKEHTYKIFDNGEALFFEELIINISSEQDIQRYGEFPIKHNMDSKLIMARTSSRDGSYVDSILRNQVGNSEYITINGLHKDSLLHIIYQKKISTPLFDSALFEKPLQNMLTYNQSMGRFITRIIYPKKQRINFYSNEKGIIDHSETDENKVFTFVIENIDAKLFESYSGEKTNRLFSYCFSLHTDTDFFNWYKGRFPIDTDFHPELPYSNEINDTIISKVYQDIINNFSIENGIRFKAQSPDQTLYFKRGTAEDLLFLCHFILKKYGIRSYPALIKKSFNENKYIQKDSFSDVILTIPDSKKYRWLDFSQNFIKAGTLTSSTYLANAYIIKDHSIEQKKTQDFIKPNEQLNFKISVSENTTDYSLTSRYFGEEENLRAYFSDKRYSQDYIQQLNASFRKEFILNTYTITNLNNYMQPFQISSSGSILNYSILATNALIIKPFLRKSSAIKLVTQSTRKSNLYIPYILTSDDSYTITVPNKYIDATIYFEKTFSFKNSQAYFKIEKRKGSNTLQCIEKIYIPKQTITTDMYEDFKDFILQINLVENRSIQIKENNNDKL